MRQQFKCVHYIFEMCHKSSMAIQSVVLSQVNMVYAIFLSLSTNPRISKCLVIRVSVLVRVK